MNGLIDEDLISLINDYETKKNKQSSMIKSKENFNNEKLPYAAIYGGLAFTCSNLISPGNIHHSFGGLLSAGLSSSSLSNSGDEIDQTICSIELEELQNLWQPTKVEFSSNSSLVTARWMKNMWNLPFNGLSVAMGGITIDKICSDHKMRQQADSIMDETIAIACADLESKGEDPKMYDWDKLVSEKRYRKMTILSISSLFLTTSFKQHKLRT